jgi:hypothetical protein
MNQSQQQFITILKQIDHCVSIAFSNTKEAIIFKYLNKPSNVCRTLVSKIMNIIDQDLPHSKRIEYYDLVHKCIDHITIIFKKRPTLSDDSIESMMTNYEYKHDTFDPAKKDLIVIIDEIINLLK